MSTIHAAAGLGGLGLLLHLGFQALLPERPFMVVSDLSVSGGVVTVERKVYFPGTVADWTASVFVGGADKPVCSGHGWNEYTPEEEFRQTHGLDEYVGDEGCMERLPKGTEARLYVFWKPRDDRDAVSAAVVFIP